MAVVGADAAEEEGEAVVDAAVAVVIEERDQGRENACAFHVCLF
jgi:hypothetical protein